MPSPTQSNPDSTPSPLPASVVEGERGDEGPHFTLVFRGDIRQLNRNPFKIPTPHGLPVATGVGNAFEARDELIEALTAASHALRSYQYGNSATELAKDIADRCDAALAKARAA